MAAPLLPPLLMCVRKPFELSPAWGSETAKPNAPLHGFHPPSPPSSSSSAKRSASSLLSNSTPYSSGIGAVVSNGRRCRLARAHSPDAEHHAARQAHQSSPTLLRRAHHDLVSSPFEVPPHHVPPTRHVAAHSVHCGPRRAPHVTARCRRALALAKPALGGTRAHRPKAEHAGRTTPLLCGGNRTSPHLPKESGGSAFRRSKLSKLGTAPRATYAAFFLPPLRLMAPRTKTRLPRAPGIAPATSTRFWSARIFATRWFRTLTFSAP